MKKAYFLYQDETIRKISNETYPELMAALKQRKPKSKALIKDEELYQLHALLPLIRLGHLRIREVEDTILFLEIWEQHPPFQTKLRKTSRQG